MSLTGSKRKALLLSEGEKRPRSKQLARKEGKHRVSHDAPAQATLPIWAGRDAILSAVAQNATVVLVGETGSGKTTQVPQFLFRARKELGLTSKSSPVIAITQPRRVAAVTLARRVAEEMRCPDPAMLPRKGSHPLSRDNNAVLNSEDGIVSKPNLPLVGYSIRFDDRTSSETRIRFMTDGFLLREMLGSSLTRLARQHRSSSSATPDMKDRESKEKSVVLAPSDLRRYGVIIIDEAHERTLDTDLLLGLAKMIQAERYRRARDWDAQEAGCRSGSRPQELRIIVMSATLDAGKFVDFFASPLALALPLDSKPSKAVNETKSSHVPVLYVRGRQHGVERFHTLEPCSDWRDAALRAIIQIHTNYAAGDILVFMTGQEDIEAMASQLRVYAPGLEKLIESQNEAREGDPYPPRLEPVPLYAALGPKGAAAAFRSPAEGVRKVVLATNIAEASVTLPGIRHVVDSGLAKVARWTSSSSNLSGGGATEILAVEPISRSSATQRAGRAGREAPGTCFHLYTSESASDLPPTTEPASAHADLSGSLLRLAAVGVAPDTFPWLDPPSTERLAETVMRLTQLGALKLPPFTVDIEGNSTGGGSPTLTPLGARMALLPLEPSLARVVLAAEAFGPKAVRHARDLVSVLSGERGIFIDPRQRERDRAKRKADARGVGAEAVHEDSDDEAGASHPFLHPSGDHATALEALYAYLRMRNQGRGGKMSPADVRTWCTNHGIDHRAAAEASRLRIQLKNVCRQQGIECDDAASDEEVEEDVGTDDSDSDGDGLPALRVTRGGVSQGRQESYIDLRRALVAARMGQYAVKAPEGGGYRRGDELVKIHPSSVLHSKRPGVIVFEEAVLTTQLFVRTVSAVEPAWLAEAFNAAH